MSNTLTLSPGHVTLEHWRAIYAGAQVRLDPASA
jgi:histidine ammonia-lyase